MEDIRLKVKRYHSNSVHGLLYSDIMLFISIISSFEFMYQTYLDPSDPANQHTLNSLNILEKVFACLFIMDWMLNFFIADHKVIFMTSFFSMVDVLTVIPIWVTAGRVCPVYDEINSAGSAVLYLLFLLATTRILRALRIRRKLSNIDDAVKRFIGEISCEISVMILFFAAVLQFLESGIQPHSFHTWMYVTWITISTVGYGDITPKSTFGRVADMMFIIFSIVTIPKMTNELFEKMKLQSVYARAAYTPRGQLSKHVVICGSINAKNLRDFLTEFFHEDHENEEMNVVVLTSEEPQLDMLLMLREPIYEFNVIYLEGSALVPKDLIRARVDSAEAVFIMADKFAAVPDEEDSKIMLQNLCIRKFLISHKAKDRVNHLGIVKRIPFMSQCWGKTSESPEKIFCMQLIKQESLHHMRSSGNSRETLAADANMVVCIDQIKMGVLSKALICPGSNTLITNLISSCNIEDSDSEDEADTTPMSSVSDSGKHTKKKAKPKHWLKEYKKGCDWEIYMSSLSEVFEGCNFAECAHKIYETAGVVLFALQITDLKAKKSDLFLNPADFIIPPKSKFKIDAFVIAKNKADADLTFPTKNNSNHNSNSNSGGNNGLSVTQLGFRLRKSSRIVIDSLDERDFIPSPSSSAKQQRPMDVNIPYSFDNFSPLSPKSALATPKGQFISQQQALMEQEEKHFQESYYLREERATMEEAFIKTDLLDEYPYINNHTVVIGKKNSNLYDLIKALRTKYLGQMRYIVLLYADIIPYELWHRISIFEGVLIVRGSPLEENTLRRVGIFRAKKVIVLADGSQPNGSSSKKIGLEALVDSDAIFSYQCVKRMNPTAQIVIEIVNQSSISYIDLDMVGDEKQYMFTPQFACGTLFTTTILDSLVCQAFYNPNIIKVVSKLIADIDPQQTRILKAQGMAELASTYSATESASGDCTSLDNIETSCLYHMSIPEKLTVKTYGALFEHLSAQGIIPLGLYRGVLAGMVFGAMQNKTPYVFTNPDKDTVLYTCDRVFVLSTKPILNNEIMSVKDWILDLQMKKNEGGKSKSKSNMSPSELLDAEALKHVVETEVSNNKSYLGIMKMLRNVRKAQKAAAARVEGAEPEVVKDKHSNSFSSEESDLLNHKTNHNNSGSNGKNKGISTPPLSQHTLRGAANSYDSVESTDSEHYNTNHNNTNNNTFSNSGSAKLASMTSPPSILRKSSVDNTNNNNNNANSTANNPIVKKKYSFSDPVVTGVSKFESLSSSGRGGRDREVEEEVAEEKDSLDRSDRGISGIDDEMEEEKDDGGMLEITNKHVKKEMGKESHEYQELEDSCSSDEDVHDTNS